MSHTCTIYYYFGATFKVKDCKALNFILYPHPFLFFRMKSNDTFLFSSFNSEKVVEYIFVLKHLHIFIMMFKFQLAAVTNLLNVKPLVHGSPHRQANTKFFITYPRWVLCHIKSIVFFTLIKIMILTVRLVRLQSPLTRFLALGFIFIIVLGIS